MMEPQQLAGVSYRLSNALSERLGTHAVLDS